MLQQLGLAELCWPHLAHSGVSASACGDSAAVRVVGVRPSATAGASASSVMKRIAQFAKKVLLLPFGDSWENLRDPRATHRRVPSCLGRPERFPVKLSGCFLHT